MTAVSHEFEKYVCCAETLKETINTFGVAIIPNVLNKEECSNIVSGIWDYFEYITSNWSTPILRNDATTWREFYKLYPLHSMLVQHWNVGHAQVSWDVRQNMKIVEIFAKFWGCDVLDLLVSFDGLSLHLPPEITNKGWRRPLTGYHTDQSLATSGFKCIQSFVTGLDINENDATLSILEGSHKFHKDFADTHTVKPKENWYKLNEEEKEFYYSQGCTQKYITCPKGSLVVWDSRTIHCGVEASKARTKINTRAIIYVCYMPFISRQELDKKLKALHELRTTSHYPCKIKMFPKIPRTYGGEVPEIKKIPFPNLNELGKSLAGITQIVI
jgi:hypothetical protein